MMQCEAARGVSVMATALSRCGDMLLWQYVAALMPAVLMRCLGWFTLSIVVFSFFSVFVLSSCCSTVLSYGLSLMVRPWNCGIAFVL